MKNSLIADLFTAGTNIRSFTPIVNEDGVDKVAGLMINPAVRIQDLDVSSEMEPELRLDLIIIKDVTEKLLYYVLHNGFTPNEEIPAHIMRYILDEDYGLLVAAYSDTNTLACAFYFDLYSRLSATTYTLHRHFYEFERIFDAVNKSEHILTEQPSKGLRLVKGDNLH